MIYHKDVNLVVRTEDFTKHKKIFDGFNSEAVMQDGLHKLHYRDVQYGNLGIEHSLKVARIPYDKKWRARDDSEECSEYCRVLSSGGVATKFFGVGEQSNINLSDALEAYQNGSMAAFLQTSKRDREPMQWEDQEVIMIHRKRSAAYLRRMNETELNKLVIDFHSDLCSGPWPRDGEDDLRVGQQDASTINNKGLETQIEFLLNSGYRSPGLTFYNPPLFELTEPDDCVEF